MGDIFTELWNTATWIKDYSLLTTLFIPEEDFHLCSYWCKNPNLLKTVILKKFIRYIIYAVEICEKGHNFAKKLIFEMFLQLKANYLFISKKNLSSNVIWNIGNYNNSYVKTRVDAFNFVFTLCNTTDPQKGCRIHHKI